MQKSQNIHSDKSCIDEDHGAKGHADGSGFSHIARVCSNALGTAWAFLGACAIVLVWALLGPMFHFSDVWQLVINTGTTIVTFLMVFLIQNTQNRDARAIHLKLDELIRCIKPARNKLIDLENCSDKDLDEMEHEFDKFRGRRRAVTVKTNGVPPSKTGKPKRHQNTFSPAAK